MLGNVLPNYGDLNPLTFWLFSMNLCTRHQDSTTHNTQAHQRGLSPQICPHPASCHCGSLQFPDLTIPSKLARRNIPSHAVWSGDTERRDTRPGDPERTGNTSRPPPHPSDRTCKKLCNTACSKAQNAARKQRWRS